MNLNPTWLRTKTAKAIAFLLLSIPLLTVVNDIRIELMFPGQGFGAEPNEAMVDRLGIWGLRLLYFTLAISSISRVLAIPNLIRFRRMAGLWAFSFVLLHFLSYAALLADFELMAIVADFTKRPYIIAGLTAFVSLIPLAITSTRGWQRRLGLNWRRVHMLVYVTAIAGWIHLFWLEKATLMESAIYGFVLLTLGVERVWHRIRRTTRKTASDLS